MWTNSTYVCCSCEWILINANLLFFDCLFFITVAIVVNFDPVVYSVSEDDTSVTLRLNASFAASNDYTVNVTTQDGTALGK